MTKIFEKTIDERKKFTLGSWLLSVWGQMNQRFGLKDKYFPGGRKLMKHILVPMAVRKQSNGTRHAFPGHNATSSMALYLLVWPSPNKAITLWIHQVWYTDQIRTIWIQSLSNGSSATNHFFDKSILRILYHNSAQSSRIFQKQQIPADALTCFSAGSLLIYKTISLSV